MSVQTRIRNLILPGLILLGAACGGEARSDLQPMQFNVDPGQVGALVEAADLGIRFQPPAGWARRPVADRDSLRRVLSDLMPDLEPHYVFLDAANGSVLSVGALAEALPLGEQVVRYGEALAARHPGASVQHDAYLKDGLHVAQFLVQAKGYVIFTLFFISSTEQLLQFDYIVPQTAYPGQIKAIESSIGSIQRIE